MDLLYYINLDKRPDRLKHLEENVLPNINIDGMEKHRISASDPFMWKDIFIDNSENILKVLDNYSKNLDDIKSAIKNKDSEKLLEIFSSTKKVRKEIIEAGQDTEKPDFGRK